MGDSGIRGGKERGLWNLGGKERGLCNKDREEGRTLESWKGRRDDSGISGAEGWVGL